MYQGFSAEINILDTGKPQKCSKLTKMTQFSHFAGARIRKILFSAENPLYITFFTIKFNNISTIRHLKLIFD